MIDERNVFDQPVKNDLKTFNNIKKTAIGQDDGYTIGCLLDYSYFIQRKLTGFDLMTVLLGKCPLAHLFYINYHLVNFDLYLQSTLHHVSKQSYFKDQPVYRCEVQEIRRLNNFFDIFYTVFFNKQSKL